MFESPLIQEIVTKEVTRVRHDSILRVLKARFRPVPPDLATAVQEIGAAWQLDKLVRYAATCPDLESFRARLRSIAGQRRQSK